MKSGRAWEERRDGWAGLVKTGAVDRVTWVERVSDSPGCAAMAAVLERHLSAGLYRVNGSRGYPRPSP